IQTSMIFFFGAGALIGFSGTGAFLTQVGLMVLMSLLLYGWLLSGKYGNLQPERTEQSPDDKERQEQPITALFSFRTERRRTPFFRMHGSTIDIIR
ncbi:hypothetical protein ACW7EJ_01965, partial [Acinetobacter soli]